MEVVKLAVMAAPLQGFTDAIWRQAHREVYGTESVSCYFSPFVRIEHGEVRRKDIADVAVESTRDAKFIPQIIFRDENEFSLLVESLAQMGFRSVDLNLGCPFSPQVKHGRGCGALVNPAMLSSVGQKIKTHYRHVSFSVKMRLGVEHPNQWRESIEILNGWPLRWLTVHPRTARQQYSGELYIDEIAAIHELTSHHLIYNGDIKSPGDIERVSKLLPFISGVMVGRGILMRPSLPSEYAQGREWDVTERIGKLMELHEKIMAAYSGKLCGESQILMKLKPFWEYLESEIGRKAWKAIKKSRNMPDYRNVVMRIG